MICEVCGQALRRVDRRFCSRVCYRARPLVPVADRFWPKVDNGRDRTDRGRGVVPNLKGSLHPNSKLTEADVRVIRGQFASGSTLKELARAYSVSADNIGLIVRRKAWCHVA